jgi:hypothetical protein
MVSDPMLYSESLLEARGLSELELEVEYRVKNQENGNTEE